MHLTTVQGGNRTVRNSTLTCACTVNPTDIKYTEFFFLKFDCRHTACVRSNIIRPSIFVLRKHDRCDWAHFTKELLFGSRTEMLNMIKDIVFLFVS